jgi:hypothetical protein
MVEASPSFSNKEIISPVSFVNMWPFGPGPPARPTPQIVSFAFEFPVLQVYFLKPDFSFPIKIGLLGSMCADIPHFAIIIKVDVGVYARGSFQDMRLRPWTFDVFSGDDKIDHLCRQRLIYGRIDISCDDIKNALVMANSRSMYTSSLLHIDQVHFACALVFAVQAIANEFPVNEIPAVVNRKSRKIFKRRIYDVVILPYTAYRRIRVATGYDGIGKNRILPAKHDGN